MVFVVPFVDVDFVTGGVEGEGAVSQSLEIYRSTMTEVAEETGSLLVEGAIAADAAGLVARTALVDPVRPSAAGHQVLADAVAAALEGSGWLR